MGGAETMKVNKKELVKILSYVVMGDGGVYYSGRNCYFAMNMKVVHSDFIEKIHSTINENITSCKLRYRERNDGAEDQLTVWSVSHPFFTKLRDRIYTGKYRGVDPHALKMLDAEALAILYMCDGSYSKDKRTKSPKAGRRVTLNLKRLSYGDLFILKKALKEKLNLEWNINKQNQYYYLALRGKDVDSFFNMVRPHICPSFYYKLSNV